MELIPGLPDDVARNCLIRVQYDNFSAVASVCRGWKGEVELPEFLQRRKAAGCSRIVVAMSQSPVDPTRKSSAVVKVSATPVYRITLCEPGTGHWCELPGFPDGLPMFCQFVGVGSDLVVMGGWNPNTWEVSKSVFVYNFVSATWRRGTDMPGCRRSFFGCATDSDRMVYVAGGHDDAKNALRSAMAYDVAKDEWIQLSDMARERDECKAVFQCGKFHVIGGYHSEMQGRFEKSAEAFDTATWQWCQVDDDFLEASTCPRTCAASEDGKLYMCREGHVAVKENTTWKTVAELPADVRNTAYVATWQGRMLVVGSPRFGEPHMAYALDLTGYTWTKMEVPEEYSGHVQSGCCFEI